MAKIVKLVNIIKLERVKYCKGCPGLNLYLKGVIKSGKCHCHYNNDPGGGSRCDCDIDFYDDPSKNKYECTYLSERIPGVGDDPMRLKQCIKLSKSLS